MSVLNLTLEAAFAWQLRLLGASLAVQSLELLLVRRAFSDHGIWRYATLRPELAALPAPLCTLARWLFPYRAFLSLLIVQLVLAATLFATAEPWFGPALLVTDLLVCLRFRGSYNGGSDSMTLLCLLASSVSLLAPDSPTLHAACLGYVAVQTTLSYFIAGVVKLRQPSWRDGTALRSFALLSRYDVPLAAKRLLQRAGVARAACALVLLFECTFPLAWLSPTSCFVYVVVAFAFHGANALLFGINRFTWAWLATYPALLCMSNMARLTT